MVSRRQEIFFTEKRNAPLVPAHGKQGVGEQQQLPRQAGRGDEGQAALDAVDEEGGKVNRVSRYPAFRQAPFPSSQVLYENGGFDAVRLDTLEKSRLLKSLGINVNFAPVCDISQDPADFIYDRSFGKDASLTSAYVETAVQAMKEEQMGCVLKHFPGYGNNADTHTGISYDRRPYETFTSSDFLPFSRIRKRCRHGACLPQYCEMYG